MAAIMNYWLSDNIEEYLICLKVLERILTGEPKQILELRVSLLRYE